MLFLSAASLAFSSTPSCPPVSFAYAFSLTDIDRSETENFYVPEDKCFYPITLPALAASGHVAYAWVPWSTVNSDLAPHGAFAYKMDDGGPLQYKKITSVSPDDLSATLKFSHASALRDSLLYGVDSFAAVMADNTEDPVALELKKALECTQAAMSYTTTEPFVNYVKFAWAAGVFRLGGVDSDCGAYIYEKKEGGLVYHSC